MRDVRVSGRARNGCPYFDLVGAGTAKSQRGPYFYAQGTISASRVLPLAGRCNRTHGRCLRRSWRQPWPASDRNTLTNEVSRGAFHHDFFSRTDGRTTNLSDVRRHDAACLDSSK